jgi:hypothetical protein
MSKIIEKLEENQFNTVKKINIKCPICNSDLYIVNRMKRVMDGNTVYHCENNEEHKFWKNSRELGAILHLNKNASATNFHSEKDYKLVDGSWNVCK